MSHIHLKTIEGKVYTIVIDLTQPLTKLIEVVIEITGIMKEELRMLYRQKQLMDCDETNRMDELGLEEHALIHVVKQLKKCSCDYANAGCV